ncbi:hypothetical protein ACSU64_27485 [Bacillaceae bacterium C204]
MKKMVSIILAIGLLAAITTNGNVIIKNHITDTLYDLPNQH